MFDDPQAFAQFRQQMLRYASLHLSDHALAEDAVQEALVGALKNRDKFRGQAAFKTWVFAILKNKIVDLLRDRRKHNGSPLAQDEQNNSADLSELFPNHGHWDDATRPLDWNSPDKTMEQNQFWQILELCLEQLPAAQARVFMMREFMNMSTEEICHDAAVSLSNLHVLLYRARLRLRECLEDRWFATAAKIS